MLALCAYLDKPLHVYADFLCNHYIYIMLADLANLAFSEFFLS